MQPRSMCFLPITTEVTISDATRSHSPSIRSLGASAYGQCSDDSLTPPSPWSDVSGLTVLNKIRMESTTMKNLPSQSISTVAKLSHEMVATPQNSRKRTSVTMSTNQNQKGSLHDFFSAATSVSATATSSSSSMALHSTMSFSDQLGASSNEAELGSKKKARRYS